MTLLACEISLKLVKRLIVSLVKSHFITTFDKSFTLNLLKNYSNIVISSKLQLIQTRTQSLILKTKKIAVKYG